MARQEDGTMIYQGIPSRYIGLILRREAEGHPHDGTEEISRDDAERDRMRRADLNEEISRASLGSEMPDYLDLLSPERGLAPVEGLWERVGRRLGLAGS